MKQKPWARLAFTAVLCAAAARSAFAADRDWKLSTSLNYDTGKYGTSVRSSSLYVPFTAKRYWGDWYASLTLPFISQTSDGQVTNVGGRPMRIRKTAASSRATTTRSGVGDVVLRGGYAVMTEDPQPFDLTAVAKVKAPTADKNKGLGTGEFDEGAGLEFGKLVAPGWTVLADAYFTKIGDPPGLDLNNQLAVDAGFSRLLQKDLTLTVLLEASNALVSGQPAPRDLSANLDYRLDGGASVFGGLLVGLSDGSPAAGFSFGGSVRF
jgi:hypothetical protein